MTGSIGLPEFFMDESKWQLILLVYFGGMIFGLPVVVWRWCGWASAVSSFAFVFLYVVLFWLTAATRDTEGGATPSSSPALSKL